MRETNRRQSAFYRAFQTGKKKRYLLTLLLTAALAMSGGPAGKGNVLYARAAGRPVSISSCQISGTEVVCQLEAGSVPASDDGKFYIYGDEVYEDGTAGEVVASTEAGASVSVSFPLNYNTPESNLSRKFLVAVKRGGQMVQVSDEHYITNPEAIAAYACQRRDGGIKGILPDITRVADGQLQELGVSQVVYNMDLDDLCLEESVPGRCPFPITGRPFTLTAGCWRNMILPSRALTVMACR